jgi:6-phosphogluconolactonase (cycloisomerase 2 family)
MRIQPLATLGVVLMMTAGYGPAAVQSAKPGRLVLYAAVGPELTSYDVEVESATLTRRGAVRLPANVQEASAHPSTPYFYVVWSDRGSAGAAPNGSVHGLTAFAIDPASGALKPHGPAVTLHARSIHTTTDGTHVLVAYNEPPGLTVHRIEADGSIGSEVARAAPSDLGIYPHQVRVDPSNTSVIVVSRGNNPTSERPEDPGSMHVFSYTNGTLAHRGAVAPGGGFGFQSRHLDFHPSGRWVFLTLERQNILQVFRRLPDGMLSAMPLFSTQTLRGSGSPRAGQATASIHVHPNGRFVYLSNRAGGTTQIDGQAVFAGGENSIAVYRIEPETGEPILIQSADTHGFTPRTFAIDPSGRLLIVANQVPLRVRDGNTVKTTPASLVVFRIRTDGRLDFARKHDVEADANRSLLWAGLVSLP